MEDRKGLSGTVMSIDDQVSRLKNFLRAFQYAGNREVIEPLTEDSSDRVFWPDIFETLKGIADSVRQEAISLRSAAREAIGKLPLEERSGAGEMVCALGEEAYHMQRLLSVLQSAAYYEEEQAPGRERGEGWEPGIIIALRQLTLIEAASQTVWDTLNLSVHHK